jgi:hypothetical protein
MASGKNYNTITKNIRPPTTTGSAVAVGSSVAAGLTRYVTFVHVSRVEGATGKGIKIYLCSTSTATKASTETLASASQKMRIILGSASGPGNISVPDRINTDKPLFSIAAGKFLSVREASTAALGNAAAAVFIQYYDQ